MVINENLSTPVLGEYDAVVVGAGPAGCGTAYALGKSGLKTLLIEKFNCLGGAWTTGFMNPFFDFRGKSGFVGELVNELTERGHFGGFWDMSFNYEYMKFILEQKLQSANVEILYNTTFSRTLCFDKQVYGVVAQNIEGRFAVLAKTVVDCTGDGCVADSAGCPFELGEDGDYKECQAMTLMFLVGNIPEKYKNGLMIYEKLNAVYEKVGKRIPFRVPYLIPVPNSHFGVIQFTHMYEYNPLSATDLTKATIEGREQLIDAFEFLTKYDEEFKDLELITSSSVLGVRESRRIIGEYRVNTDDILSGARFDDAVAFVTFGADLHTKSNKGQNCFQVQPYHIPLRALIPQGYKGIVVAGRCISGSREAMASYRVTGNCAQMGENAGYYIAEAIKRNLDILEVKLNLPLVSSENE
ncbi:MAG: FAD-dependent oxidoreductase [Clostridia bacterium]|nr:FAD-dependent oxidoreductase [Clostridia bacterium]